jgi:hypothetical protein
MSFFYWNVYTTYKIFYFSASPDLTRSTETPGPSAVGEGHNLSSSHGYPHNGIVIKWVYVWLIQMIALSAYAYDTSNFEYNANISIQSGICM